MATIYLRNVPPDVVARLEKLAASDGMSVSAFAVRELTAASKRAENVSLLGDLADHQISVEQIVGAVVDERHTR